MGTGPHEVLLDKDDFYNRQVELVKITLPDHMKAEGSLTGVRRGSTVTLLMEAGAVQTDKLIEAGYTVEPCYVIPASKLSEFLETSKNAVRESEQEP